MIYLKIKLFLPCISNVNFVILGIRNYSSFPYKNYYYLDPWFITDLLDAEGYFVITILNNPRFKIWWTKAIILIKIHEINRPLILFISHFYKYS